LKNKYILFESVAEKLGLPPNAATPKLSGLTNAVTEVLLFVLQTVKGEM
jgi:hypothetical protein